MTDLYEAIVDDGNLELCKELIAQGADVNAARDDEGWTPLHYAAVHGHLEICKYLVEQGADVNAKDVDGNSVLLCTAISEGNDFEQTLEVCKYLVEQGADVNAKTEHDIILNRVVGTENFELCKYLVEQGADVNAEDGYGCTPLDWAKNCENQDIYKWLLERGAKSCENQDIYKWLMEQDGKKE